MAVQSHFGQSFFRDYASMDDHEFFAVAVENFFERPHEFEKNHPELFQVLGALLNQEPPLITDH
jgi:MtfA peptidase